MARPKKEGAIKAGELKEGLIRFSFIADANKIEAVKKLAKKNKVTLKELMGQALDVLLKSNATVPEVKDVKMKQTSVKKTGKAKRSDPDYMSIENQNRLKMLIAANPLSKG
jgi:hypothetical protein